MSELESWILFYFSFLFVLCIRSEALANID